MASPNQQDGRTMTLRDVTLTTSASVRVFVIPELVERILEYASPASLYGLRRVSTILKDTIALKKFRPSMFLDPSGRIDIMRLVRFFQSGRIQRIIAPFTISAIRTAWVGRAVIFEITLPFAREVYDGRIDIAVLGSPCHRAGSWRKIKLDLGVWALEVHLRARDGGLEFPRCPSGGYFVWRYAPTDEVTLGRLMEDCVI